jgi:hypothetical protein
MAEHLYFKRFCEARDDDALAYIDTVHKGCWLDLPLV